MADISFLLIHLKLPGEGEKEEDNRNLFLTTKKLGNELLRAARRDQAGASRLADIAVESPDPALLCVAWLLPKAPFDIGMGCGGLPSRDRTGDQGNFFVALA